MPHSPANLLWGATKYQIPNCRFNFLPLFKPALESSNPSLVTNILFMILLGNQICVRLLFLLLGQLIQVGENFLPLLLLSVVLFDFILAAFVMNLHAIPPLRSSSNGLQSNCEADDLFSNGGEAGSSAAKTEYLG